ncbi:MAG: acetyltransferase [Ignavibacteriae bacterium]|nr:acetyltransferase [Ignavibacteriota bacterium]
MKKIAIFGAGGFGREVQMLIDHINLNVNEWNLIGFFDDGISKGIVINDIPVLGGMTELNCWADELYVVFAIGNPITKKKIVNSINNEKIKYPVLIHPNVIIGNNKYVKIGQGSIICAGVIITVNIDIGEHVILNLSCTVGHDTIIGNYSSFMPTVNISGEVIIKDCVYVGTGAKIINQLEIGENTIIGAGALVAKNLPANCTAVGLPAKPVKFHS